MTRSEYAVLKVVFVSNLHISKLKTDLCLLIVLAIWILYLQVKESAPEFLNLHFELSTSCQCYLSFS